MLTYHYTALDLKGKKHRGQLRALHAAEAARHIKEQGLFPVRVQAASERSLPFWLSYLSRLSQRFQQRAKIPPKQLTHFTRQLAILLGASIPLVEALRILEDEQDHVRLRHVITSLVQSVEAGKAFSKSLEEHPRVFTPLYISMARAGEAMGSLSHVLTQLSLFLENRQKLQAKILAALAYPAVVMGVSAMILVFLLVFIVPRFKQIFADILNGKPLPLLTQIVVQTSELFIRLSWPIPYTLFLALGMAASISFLKTQEPCIQLFDRLRLHLPVLGKLTRKIALNHIASTLATLLAHGVALLGALRLTQETTAHRSFRAALEKVHTLVQSGESFASALQATGLFPPMVVSMVRVGEETGQLSAMFSKIAEIYEEEIQRSIQTLMSLIEPLMIVLLALVVGVMVIAIFLPIMTLINDLSAR